MKQRIIPLLLALALALSICGASALAEEQSTAEEQTTDTEGASAETDGNKDAAPETPGDDAGAADAAPSPAGPDPEEADTAYVPDAVGTISFSNLERRMRENNLNLLALEENIASIEVIDYDKMYESLRESLNGIALAQRYLLMDPTGLGSESYTYNQLDQTYDSLRDTFESLKDGELQEDNAGVIRQLKNVQDQVVMAGESLYTALVQLEAQEASLQRQLTSLNRTVEEMGLRYQLGQISALQLEQTKAGRTSLVSGLETVQMNIQSLKTQLEMLIGAEMTGDITLGSVPEVTAEQLEKMDLETDLAAAKERSYELYAAEQTLKDAKEDYIDGLSQYGYSSTRYERQIVEHTWQAAQYTYDGTVQSYELSFRTLYAQVGDYQQVLNAARVSLTCQKDSYAATQLKYQQGTISKNTLLSAEDDLRAAEDTVQNAAIDLFSAYNTYCWAVQHGILN
ncbi:Outer membrane protein TolC [Oscillibacter sp. PC13]|uniref:TolC family protein n=1 Tax=Oscillibacter sp. PC13 TaxID=1855299 RepID=UPI0008ECBE33|nr:TolC family protein [Oscillibacter sp. PC13]SFP44312.1 Outer membrane protein TolC [Oscillibacter sp. PC13]